MLKNSSQDLVQLHSKNQDQGLQLQNIFLELNKTQNQLSSFQVSISPSQNLLNKVRPEVFNQILEFVDLKYYVRFRLISKRANQTVIQMIPNRIAQIQQIIINRQSKLQELMQGYPEDDLLQGLQRAEGSLISLRKAHINEMKQLTHPPIIVEKVMTMVCILLDPTFKKSENSNWTACQKMIGNLSFIIQLLNFDIHNLDDNRLKLLQDIHSISAEQVQGASFACLSFYLYISAIVAIRESKMYQIRSQKGIFEKLIKSDQMALLQLQKMNDQ